MLTNKSCTMKKMFFICCIAISALAVSTSANTNKQQSVNGSYVLNDTVPNTLDTTNNNWNSDSSNHNMDTSMNMHRDSTKL